MYEEWLKTPSKGQKKAMVVPGVETLALPEKSIHGALPTPVGAVGEGVPPEQGPPVASSSASTGAVEEGSGEPVGEEGLPRKREWALPPLEHPQATDGG
jgi:hypothetical protein